MHGTHYITIRTAHFFQPPPQKRTEIKILYVEFPDFYKEIEKKNTKYFDLHAARNIPPIYSNLID
jgi:hypothetical protein